MVIDEQIDGNFRKKKSRRKAVKLREKTKILFNNNNKFL